MRSVVFITADTLGRSVCQAYDAVPGARTPQLARFAERAATCDRAYCAAPLCTPARAAWFTGLLPGLAGPASNGLTARRDVPMLAEILAAAGYRCSHLGKWHLDGGGTEGRGRHDGGFTADWYDERTFLVEVGGDGERFGNWKRGLRDRAWCFGERVAQRSEEILREHRYGAAPLFLAVEFDEPHGPYICPPPFNGATAWADCHRPASIGDDLADKPRLQQGIAAHLRGDRADPGDLARSYRYYYDCLAWADHCIGRVVDAVRAHAPPDTAIVITADHGDHLGAFGLGPKGPTMYESCIGVPLLLDVPGVTRPGQRLAAPVAGVDCFATLLDLAGAWDPARFAANRGYDCRSLLPQVVGAEDGRRHACIAYDRFGFQDALDGFHPIRCITDGRLKLAVNLFDRDECYDLEADPDERHNRIDDPALAPRRDALHDELLAWQRRSRDPLAGRCWRERPWRGPDPTPVRALFPTGHREAGAERPFR